jgi:O-Antigen ligase
MRRAVPAVAAGLLLAGPTVLAFHSGGYFAEPRLIAAIGAWLLVLALALTGPAPLPRSTAGRIALAGLAGLTVWTALSLTWAPLSTPALDATQRLVLYTGALLLAIGALRHPRALRAVEPALAAGATIVIGYGLSGRLLPGLIELDRSESAGGRLEQPLTYWNAEGALAAIGFVLCARLAGDPSRPRAVRAAAAAATAPLGAGVYLSYSRGAIAVAVLGLLVLLAAAPTRVQLRAALVAAGAGAASAAAAAALPWVASLEGTHRTRDGAIALAALLLISAAAAAVAARQRRDAPLQAARALRPLAAAAVLAVIAGLLAGGASERPTAAELAEGAAPQRLASVSSNRYEYWRVGLDTFAEHPLHGTGAGGFRVEWLMERRIHEAVRDAHSLEVEVAAELGLVGLIALSLLIGGVALAARAALARDPAAAAGATAATLTWFLHASIDWDWQLPAVTLPAIVLAGGLIVIGERSADPAAPAARSPARTAPDRARA